MIHIVIFPVLFLNFSLQEILQKKNINFPLKYSAYRRLADAGKTDFLVLKLQFFILIKPYTYVIYINTLSQYIYLLGYIMLYLLLSFLREIVSLFNFYCDCDKFNKTSPFDNIDLS